MGLSETVELAGKAVPSSRKINGKALTGDVSLSAGDVGAVSTQRLAEISNNGKFQDCLSTGFYRVGVFDSNTVSDFPRDSVNTVLYSYGILEVQTSSETISQRYTSHIGQIAIRQSWDSGKTWHGWYVAYDNNSRDVVTAGIPLPYPHRYAPVGYLACNGQTFDKSRYPKLALAYPDGRIPDLRGEFIRGWDDSRGIDPGRVCGTWQGDAIRNITGSFPGAIASNFHLAAQGAFYGELNLGIATDGTPKSANINPDNAYGFGFDASRVVPTANETRPRNVAFNYIVRAA
ncbi:phage tail protein [Photorhabdus caribbeanensis]|nr:phage tail protein [Photorhabdus caribbeanensis]